MDDLPRSVLLPLLASLPSVELSALCQRPVVRALCQEDELWTERLRREFPGLVRPPDVRSATFYQEVTRWDVELQNILTNRATRRQESEQTTLETLEKGLTLLGPVRPVVLYDRCCVQGHVHFGLLHGRPYRYVEVPGVVRDAWSVARHATFVDDVDEHVKHLLQQGYVVVVPKVREGPVLDKLLSLGLVVRI